MKELPSMVHHLHLCQNSESRKTRLSPIRVWILHAPSQFEKDLPVAAERCGSVYSLAWSLEPSIRMLYPIYLPWHSNGVWSNLQTDEVYPASFCLTMERRSRRLQNSLVSFSKMRLFRNTWLPKEASGFSVWNVRPGGEVFWTNDQIYQVQSWWATPSCLREGCFKRSSACPVEKATTTSLSIGDSRSWNARNQL